MSEKENMDGLSGADSVMTGPDSVSATLPGTPPVLDENLEAAADEYGNLKSTMEKLLNTLDPSHLEQRRKAVDRQGKILGVSMDAPLAAMGEMAEDLRDRIVQIRCFLQSIFNQKPGPDYTRFLEIYKNVLEPSMRKIYDENDISGRKKMLKEKVRTAFADCKTLADCYKTIKALSESDTDIAFSECPRFMKQPQSEGVRVWLADSTRTYSANDLGEQDISRACLVTVQLTQGEVKILGFEDIDIKQGTVLHAGLNLALIERVSENHEWFQSSGDGVAHQHSTINDKK